MNNVNRLLTKEKLEQAKRNVVAHDVKRLAEQQRAAHDMVGKEVRFKGMPDQLRSIIKGDTGTVLRFNGKSAVVKVGQNVHNIDPQFLMEVAPA